MRSIGFPKIFNSNSTNVINDNEANLSNYKLLILSEKGTFKEDPFYGVRLNRVMFEQNTSAIEDILIDDIYTQSALFMPQFLINREDIKIKRNKDGKKGVVGITIKAMNRKDYTTNMYDIVLLQEEE